MLLDESTKQQAIEAFELTREAAMMLKGEEDAYLLQAGFHLREALSLINKATSK